MTTLLLSLLAGAAIWLVFDGLTRGRTPGAAGRRPSAVRDWLNRAGLHDVSARDFVLFSLGAGVVAGVVAQVMLDMPAASAGAAAIGAAAPFAWYRRRQGRRRAAVQSALADAIERMRDSIRSGLTVQEAFAGLARTGPEALRAEFATLSRQARLEGFQAAMTQTRDRLADPLFDVVATSLLLNDRVGGRNVTQVLDRLAQSTRAELRVQEEIRAYQAKSVLSARVIAALPLVVLVIIRKINPAYLDVYGTPEGQVVLAGCFVAILAGYLMMLRITRLASDRRVLR